jgi:pimeloyl-ACP methyl ester carboxylesterase
VVGLVALLLGGCAPAKPAATAVPVAAPSATASIDPKLKEFYEQKISWKKCDTFQCATAKVPIDYANPAAGSIELALKRARATKGDAIGSLVINPGGPGVSGVNLVDSAVTTFGKGVVAKYDIVGFDPRGVGKSHPVKCQSNAAKDELIGLDFDYSTDAGIAAAKAMYTTMGKACAANTGPLLAHVDTVSAAKDMDVLRAALGDKKLSYLGYSYGTALGATYAGLFPDRVGRMVLDGALDPTTSSKDLALIQAKGFQNALRAYVVDCEGGPKCPLTGDVNSGLAQIHDLVERARRSPLPTGTNRPLTGSLASYGIIFPLYDNQYWPLLSKALTKAIGQNDGSILLKLSDIYNDRNQDGTYSANTSEAFTAINCLDGTSTADPAEMRADTAEIVKVAPTLGAFFGFGGVACAGWPYPATGKPGPITAKGAAPILVIGTTNDPATPYAWAQGLAKQLSSGVLLTYQGEGHTAYGRSNGCIAGTVDAYLLAGTVPKDGKRC